VRRALGGACLLLAVLGPVARGQGPDTTVHDLADISDKPAMLTHSDLGYKDCYKDAGLTGTDLVKFIIDTAGRVEPGSVQLAAVSDPMLDTLAVHVVRGMKFRPGAVAGAPVRVSVSLPVHSGMARHPRRPRIECSARVASIGSRSPSAATQSSTEVPSVAYPRTRWRCSPTNGTARARVRPRGSGSGCTFEPW